MDSRRKSIKNFDYSSDDSQILIREYTKLISDLAVEYEILAKQNEELRLQLEKVNGTNAIPLKKQTKNLKFFIKRLILVSRLYGWKKTVKKIRKRLDII